MRRSVARRLATVVLAAGLVLSSGLAVPASARPAARDGAAVTAQQGKAKAAGKERGKSEAARAKAAAKAAAKAKKRAEARARKAARFNAGGFVVSVDSPEMAFVVKGGPVKALRGKPVTVTVPAGARVRLDDEPVTVDDLLPGDHVRVRGVRLADGTVLAVRVNASRPDPDEDDDDTDAQDDDGAAVGIPPPT